MDIKIFGERNSGTNFIKSLLDKNLKDINILSYFYKGGSGWKHGKPMLELFNNNDNVLFICAIRNLDSWLSSMYHRPYHMKKRDTFYNFITKPTINNDPRKDHDTHIYDYEINKNLFQLRYFKYEEYKKLLNNNNCILVNLNYLQKNPEEFINSIASKFNLSKNNFAPIPRHYAPYKKYSLNDYNLEKFIDISLEKEIGDLDIIINNTQNVIHQT